MTAASSRCRLRTVLKTGNALDYDVPADYLGFWALCVLFLAVGFTVKSVAVPEVRLLLFCGAAYSARWDCRRAAAGRWTCLVAATTGAKSRCPPLQLTCHLLHMHLVAAAQVALSDQRGSLVPLLLVGELPELEGVRTDVKVLRGVAEESMKFGKLARFRCKLTTAALTPRRSAPRVPASLTARERRGRSAVR